MFERLTETGGQRSSLKRLGRALDARVILRATSAESAIFDDTLVVIRDGLVIETIPGPHVMPSVDFLLIAPRGEWESFLAPVPGPGRHDLMALLRRGAIRFEGDLHKLMANLMYFKKLLASLRPVNTEAR